VVNKDTVTASGNPASRGLILIFTGDGKGKTSAAVGTAVRALGHNLKVYIAVFMKGERPSGEWTFLSSIPEVKIERFGCAGFCNPAEIKPEEKEQAGLALAAAGAAIQSGLYDVVILDEVNVAVAWKLIEKSELLSIIDKKPFRVELVLTGRLADPELVRRADLVTEMLKIKHPYDTGVSARPGIEY
jgi:cob(I)alamin adenosyltransferase